jgi:protocatechuate 3,4-dioxygenase beta subunit
MRIAASVLLLLLACIWGEAQPLASVSGSVVDFSTGAPLANVRVGVRTSDGHSTAEFTAFSDSQGRYSISAIPPGRYVVAPEAPPHRFFVPILAKNGLAASELFLKVGDRVDNVNLQIARPAVITGRVVGDEGEPIPFAHVRASLVKQLNPPVVARGGFGQTDDRGRYRLVCSPGKYIVGVEPAKEDTTYESDLRADGEEFQYGLTYFPSEREAENAGVVNARPDGETTGIDIQITHKPTAVNKPAAGESAMVEGVVVDAVTGKPLDHARVTFGLFNMDAPGRAYYAISRGDGTYRITGLPAGRYTAFAYRPGYLGGSIMVPAIIRDLKDGEHAVADLQ